MNSIITSSSEDRLCVEVQCNWDSNIPDKCVQDTIILRYCDEEENQESENLNDIVNVKTTVSFIGPDNNDEKPVVHFKIPSYENIYINSITLLCDSRTVEVFGDHNIYLNTTSGTAIEETDEFYVYEYKIDFKNKINKEVSLKFIKLAHTNSLWIYGILLKLKGINQGKSSINYDNVQELLKNCHISDQATRVFSFLKDANTHFGSQNNDERDDSKHYDSQRAQYGELKQYIDHKFQILTEYLILREKNMNDKMDHILNILKSKK